MPRSSAAQVGHNSKLTEAEQQSLYSHHLGKIQRQRAKVDVERAAEKQLRKEAKVDGIILSDIDFGMRCSTVEDDTIIQLELQRRVRIASWLGLAPGTQGDLFSFTKDTSVKAAGRAGAAAGFRAAERKSPHDAGTPEDQAWLTNYDGSQAQARDNLQTAMEKKTQERLAAARRNTKPEDPGTQQDKAA